MQTRTVLLGGVVLMAACVHEDHRPTQYAELKKRASFDLKCDEASLKLVPIKEIDTDYGCAGQHHLATARTAGVTCSDSRAPMSWSAAVG